MRDYAAPQEQQLAPRPDAAGRFGRIAVTLGFDEPTFFGQRHDAVLAVIKRASEMSAAELATLCAAQSAHMSLLRTASCSPPNGRSRTDAWWPRRATPDAWLWSAARGRPPAG